MTSQNKVVLNAKLNECIMRGCITQAYLNLNWIVLGYRISKHVKWTSYLALDIALNIQLMSLDILSHSF